jgi:transposase
MRYARRGGYTPAEQQRRERLRLEAASRFARGDKIGEIARDLRVTEGSARRWHRAWRDGGAEALRSRGPVSREKLSPQQWARLEMELRKGPLAHGFANDQRWTLGRIKTLIGKLFHVGYTVEGTWKLMRRHGWSSQVPVRQALADFAEQDKAWLRIYRLPAYTPDLNPVEGIWSLARHPAPHRHPAAEDPRHRALRGGGWLRRQPDDVPGVDTKFIEGHERVLAQLLDLQLDPARVNRAAPRPWMMGSLLLGVLDGQPLEWHIRQLVKPGVLGCGHHPVESRRTLPAHPLTVGQHVGQAYAPVPPWLLEGHLAGLQHSHQSRPRHPEDVRGFARREHHLMRRDRDRQRGARCRKHRQ